MQKTQLGYQEKVKPLQNRFNLCNRVCFIQGLPLEELKFFEFEIALGVVGYTRTAGVWVYYINTRMVVGVVSVIINTIRTLRGSGGYRNRCALRI